MGQSGNAHDAPALRPGVRVGEYELVREIGRGGMGTVYLGVHPIIGKQVAIKVLAAALSHDRDMANRFIQEARTANDIGHPNIVDVFSFGQLPTGELYLVMDYLVGESLETRLERQPPLSLLEVAHVFTVVCDALGAAHARGVVHRDLKPDNIFLVHRAGQSPDVKLLDFGIAKLLDPQMSLTRTTGNQVFGTPVVMSPEQAVGGDVDVRSDVYSLGVILFRALTGDYPFDARSALQLLQMHVSKPPPRPSTLAPVPAALDEIVLACLAKSAAARPGLDEVRAALRGSLVVAPRRRRPRASVVYLGTMLASLAVGLAIMAVVMRHHRATPASLVVAKRAPATAVTVSPVAAPELPAPPMPELPARAEAKTSPKRKSVERARPRDEPTAAAPTAAPKPATPPSADDEDATIDWKPANPAPR